MATTPPGPLEPRGAPAPLVVSRAGVIAAALIALVVMATLVGVFLVVREQRDIAERQREIGERQLQVLSPLIEDTRPLVTAARRADVPRATRNIGRLTDTVIDARPGAVLASVAEVSSVLSTNDRLERMLRSAITVLGSVRATDLVDRASTAARLAPRLEALLDRSLQIQTRTLALQRQTLAINRANLTTARETLATAQRTEVHAASLDRKLGGTLPGAR